jgi:hypothetical protein
MGEEPGPLPLKFRGLLPINSDKGGNKMGTPTVITFQGAGNYGPAADHNLFRHNDGDPVTQLDIFATILRKAHDLAHEYASEAPHISEHCIVTPSTLTGLYIGETTGCFGMIAEVLTDAELLYGEWLYRIDTDEKTIEITDNDGSPLDPYSYLDKLHAEYVPQHRGSLDASLARLDDMGYKVLPNCIEAIR